MLVIGTTDSFQTMFTRPCSNLSNNSNTKLLHEAEEQAESFVTAKIRSVKEKE